MKISFFILICFVIAFSLCAQTNGDNRNDSDIIIENEQFKLTVDSNAIAKSLKLKSTREECLIPGAEFPQLICCHPFKTS